MKSRHPGGVFLAWGVLWATLGFLLVFFRVLSIHTPMVSDSRGPLWIRGDIYRIDHKASSQRLFQRCVLTLDPWIQKRYLLPKRVLLTIRTTSLPLEKGDRIRVRALLNPIPGPCLPGGYDPRLVFFFQQIGAGGFSITEPRVVHKDPQWIDRYRNVLTRTLHRGLKPPLGALACSLITGDSAALPPWVRQVFSDSGMAHLLAISGLHISMVCGLCFFFFHAVLAAIPWLPLYRDIRKISALGALFVGWLYLTLSGQNYPAQRAFLMTAATLLATMVSRRRHAMRILMLCAGIFLLVTPEALMSISYQLSFVAVATLLASTEWKTRQAVNEITHPVRAYVKNPWNPSFFKDRIRKLMRIPFMYRMRRTVKSTFISSVLITVTTLPIIVHSFHFMSLQGIFSNVLAIPYTGVVVMPLGLMVMASGCAPFMLRVWEVALEGLLSLSVFFSKNTSFLMMHFPIMGGWQFFLSMMGICWILLWQKSWRWWGLALFAGGFITSFGSVHNRILFLIDADRHLTGYVDRASSTLYVSSKRRGRFVVQKWMRAYGLRHIKVLQTGSFVSLSDGKKVFIGDGSCPFGVDFAIGEGPFPVGVPHVDTRFLKGGVYGMTGLGSDMISTQHQRPWQPGYVRFLRGPLQDDSPSREAAEPS